MAPGEEPTTNTTMATSTGASKTNTTMAPGESTFLQLSSIEGTLDETLDLLCDFDNVVAAASDVEAPSAAASDVAILPSEEVAHRQEQGEGVGAVALEGGLVEESAMNVEHSCTRRGQVQAPQEQHTTKSRTSGRSTPSSAFEALPPLVEEINSVLAEKAGDYDVDPEATGEDTDDDEFDDEDEFEEDNELSHHDEINYEEIMPVASAEMLPVASSICSQNNTTREQVCAAGSNAADAPGTLHVTSLLDSINAFITTEGSTSMTGPPGTNCTTTTCCDDKDNKSTLVNAGGAPPPTSTSGCYKTFNSSSSGAATGSSSSSRVWTLPDPPNLSTLQGGGEDSSSRELPYHDTPQHLLPYHDTSSSRIHHHDHAGSSRVSKNNSFEELQLEQQAQVEVDDYEEEYQIRSVPAVLLSRELRGDHSSSASRIRGGPGGPHSHGPYQQGGASQHAGGGYQGRPH
ncbi:unnamed protein product, partial [Amoebophrya sp. A25]|eukprot:GSA25T00022374001.1